MLKKITAFLAFFVMIFTSVSSGVSSAFAAEYVFPQAYWGYSDSYQKSIKEKNVDDTLKYGNLILQLFKNDQSIQANENRYNIYKEFVNIYQARQDYDKTAEALEALIKCSEFLGFDDAVKLNKEKLQSFKLNIDVYAETKNTSVVPYYNQRVEPRSGVYIGRTYSESENAGVPKTADEGIISFYALFGEESYSSFDWFIRPYDDNTRILHFAWNLFEENSGLQSILDGKYDQHIISTLNYINSIKSPTMLRIFGEMNVWEDLADPDAFKKAYIRIANFARQYAPNTALVFAPNATSNWTTDINDYYPGDEYVDWVGVSLYTSKYFKGSREAREDFNEAYYYNGIYENAIVLLKDIVARYGNKKPIIITEGGAGHTMRSNNEDLSASGKKYMEQVYNYIGMLYPQVKAAIYFDKDMDNGPFLYSLAKSSVVRDAYFRTISSNPVINKNLVQSNTAYTKLSAFNESTNSLNLATYAVFPSFDQTTVEYYLNGNLHTRTTQIPYRASINTAEFSNGNNSIEVIVKNGTYSKKLEYSISKSGTNIAAHNGEIAVSDTNTSIKAVPSAVTANVDGRIVTFHAYNIQDSNYLKLRDLAYIINNSPKQIEIAWDSAKNAINVISKTPYTSAGSEMQPNSNEVKKPVPTSSALYLDGKEISLTAYNIDGNNYFKLRDMAKAFNFRIDWDGSVIIKTTESFVDN